MKKVFLSLAVVAALTVVSCKQADAAAEATADTTVVAEPAADTTTVVADTTAADTTAAAPATEAPAAK
ncbi:MULTISPECIES: hypothetical protein [unclassified Flavobacterium]|uniref:hypothetical protein n=1 Tax=unclassified Flavobacterium TaxID=196869 RepID=UPI000EB34C28|nr:MULTISPECIES: hypothetical protein [unclassified Flavobacterium]RKS00723.1 hypothetical protein C8C84_0347 [Flavobacterium sp. 102]